jgi:PAS domain S-box-containing protein
MDSSDKNEHAREILDNYELRFRAMAEHVTLGMFQVSHGPDSHVISVNSVMAQMLGFSHPDELSGKPTRDFFIQAEKIDHFADDLIRSGAVTGRETLLRRKDGSEIRVSVQVWKLQNPGSPLIVMEGFVEDTTEHWVFEQEMHYHESELNRFAFALSQANKKLNILSSITRHDIINKLTGLQMYMELMKDDCLDPKVQEYLTLLEGIIRTISLQIDFTKDYQDIGVATPHWFDVGETVRNATSSLPLSKVSLAIDTGDLSIYADPMLEKVFYNLVENALRHGGNVTAIRFFSEVSGSVARIICEDNGNGVAAEYKEAIFVRQYFKNTGFGLFLSREILEITGLSIRETGSPGKGARFEISVPAGYFRAGNTAP